MGLMDLVRHELIDIVEWIDDTRHSLVWRFPRSKNEIKNGAQLIVRPGQAAVFVDQGKVADVFEPGRHELTTSNLPVLSTLKGWKHGFESPFKAEVYFVSTTQITDLKWGTPNAVMLRDADFGPVRLRAFGTYALKASDPKILIQELAGTTGGEFDPEELTQMMRSMIATSFAQLIGEAKIPALDLAANYQTMSNDLKKRVPEQIDDEYGLELTQMFIVNISLPEAVQKAMDTRSSMGVIGDMQKFQQYQMGQAMLAAAENPSAGGLGAAGAGMGLGMAMAQQMAQPQMGMPMGGGMPPAAPPPPVQQVWHISVNGQNQGPFMIPALMQMISQGQLLPTTMVWTGGMSAWTPAGQVPQLMPYFQNAAPPPPPPPNS